MEQEILEILSQEGVKWAGKKVICLDSVDSTNEYARKLAGEGGVHGLLVVADYQSGGKGRRGRSWVTPPGTAIAMSLVLRPEIDPERVSMLTLVAGLAVAEAIRKETGLPAMLKWPNDVVVNGKKVTGILTELAMKEGRIDYVVAGIGINVNLTEFPEELRGTATSLLLETGKPADRTAIICEVLKAFEVCYERFMEYGSLQAVKQDYEKILVNKDQTVRVLEPGNEYSGIAKGIDDLGQLLVEKEDGTLTKVFAGEVSVRGIYRYV